ncbi:MAG TPA: MFS transporter [Bryobacteraceae bacterium]
MPPLKDPVLRALLEALQLQNASAGGLQNLTVAQWNDLLTLCDKSQTTLLLRCLHRDDLPAWVRERIDGNWRDNIVRSERWHNALREIAAALSQNSIGFILLKGTTHSPDLSPDPLLRGYGDIDLWCLPEEVHYAQAVLQSLDYRPVGTSKSRHLAPMVRQRTWEWRGDYFDPDLPLSVDLHYQLWDGEMECIAGPDEREMWLRSVVFSEFAVLDKADTLTFAALHLLMHLLHGDLRLQRAWEIAYFLHTHFAATEFWRRWQTLYPDDVRRVQLVIFSLAHLWFGCELPPLVAVESKTLPPEIQLWIARYGWSPVSSLVTPSKDELWLNLSLLGSWRDKCRILARRLLPVAGASTFAAESQIPRIFFWHRLRHHTRSFLPTCLRGLAWWCRSRQLSRDFLKYLLASALFDFGEFIFFLLYNLYLLDLGYHEQFIGQISATMTAGTLAGVLPAAAIGTRAGLRAPVLLAIIGVCGAATFRALFTSPTALFASAFLNGFFMAFWAVTLLPAVAGFTTENKRPFGFALISSLGIGIGAIAGFIGGRLPALITHFAPLTHAVTAKRAALLSASVFATFALIPALFTRFPRPPEQKHAQRAAPHNRFLLFFLLCVFIWMTGTGGFNPFFNVYFASHHHLSVEKIGSIFSFGQLAQVVAILLAPAILKRLGQTAGIVTMQLATAATLILLAIVPGPRVCAVLYIGYVCFQYMSEPCLFSVLMSRVPEALRNRASAWNFGVTSIAGIFAASAAGALLAKSGYSVTLTACAALVIVAALLFLLSFRPALPRRLAAIRRQKSPSQAEHAAPHDEDGLPQTPQSLQPEVLHSQPAPSGDMPL